MKRLDRVDEQMGEPIEGRSVDKSGDNFHLVEPMRRAGVTQGEVATELGCSDSTFSRFLSGERKLPAGQGARAVLAAIKVAAERKAAA